MRPSGRLPRLIVHVGAEVYAPWCESCRNDDQTRWQQLPALGEVERGWSTVRAFCSRCEKDCYVSQVDAWRAREPERLAQRLADLRARAV